MKGSPCTYSKRFCQTAAGCGGCRIYLERNNVVSVRGNYSGQVANDDSSAKLEECCSTQQDAVSTSCQLVEHHIKYKEIHGKDETEFITLDEHQAIHNKLRQCGVGLYKLPKEVRYKIYSSAHERTDKSKLTKRKYREENIRPVEFVDLMSSNIWLYERINYNLNSETVTVFSWFAGHNKAKLKVIDETPKKRYEVPLLNNEIDYQNIVLKDPVERRFQARLEERHKHKEYEQKYRRDISFEETVAPNVRLTERIMCILPTGSVTVSSCFHGRRAGDLVVIDI